jgi:hypothetical protein
MAMREKIQYIILHRFFQLDKLQTRAYLLNPASGPVSLEISQILLKKSSDFSKIGIG